MNGLITKKKCNYMTRKEQIKQAAREYATKKIGDETIYHYDAWTAPGAFYWIPKSLMDKI